MPFLDVCEKVKLKVKGVAIHQTASSGHTLLSVSATRDAVSLGDMTLVRLIVENLGREQTRSAGDNTGTAPWPICTSN